MIWSRHLTCVTTSVRAGDAPTPSVPTNLEASHLSPTSVFLRWEWEDDTVALDDVEFIVAFSSFSAKEIVPDASVKGKLYLVQSGLESAADYQITVSVTVNGLEIEGATVSIDTLEGECMRTEFPDESNRRSTYVDPT